MKIKILFVCTGNICRSPMAEAVMGKLIAEAGLEKDISIDSAGLISYHQGEYADHRARAILEKHGIDYAGHAKGIGDDDFNSADYIIAMTNEHLQELKYRQPQSSNAKIQLLMDFADTGETEVRDPYYNGNFEETYQLIEQGCRGLLAHLQQQLAKSEGASL